MLSRATLPWGHDRIILDKVIASKRAAQGNLQSGRVCQCTQTEQQRKIDEHPENSIHN